MIKKWEFRHNSYERLQKGYEEQRARARKRNNKKQESILTEKVRAARVAKLISVDAIKGLEIILNDLRIS